MACARRLVSDARKSAIALNSSECPALSPNHPPEQVPGFVPSRGILVPYCLAGRGSTLVPRPGGRRIVGFRAVLPRSGRVVSSLPPRPDGCAPDLAGVGARRNNQPPKSTGPPGPGGPGVRLRLERGVAGTSARTSPAFRPVALESARV